MGRIPAALILSAGIGVSAYAAAQTPEMVYGTADGAIELFSPVDVVTAGATEAASTYRFFAHENLTVPTVTTATNVAATGPGYQFVLFPEKTFSDGLQVGPFHSAYEGVMHAATAARQSLRLIVTAKHEFSDGKTLSTSRTLDYLVVFADGVDITLSDFSSITALALGTVTADDGSTITITDALLAEPVKITVQGEIQTLMPGAGTRAAGQLASLSGELAAVSWFQLRDPILNAGGGGGGGASLSNKIPLVESGSGAAGSGNAASRDDHVHPANPQVATNTTAIGTNTTAIGTNAASAAANKTRFGSLGTSSPPTDGTCAQAASTGSKLDFADCTTFGSATPAANTNAGTVGTSADASRSDHAHPGLSVPQIFPEDVGRALSAKSTTALQWVPGLPAIDGADEGRALVVTSATAKSVDWRAISGTTLSNAKPADLGTAAAGSSTAGSRSDHVHKRPAEIADNTAAAAAALAAAEGKPGLSNADPKPVGSAAATGSGSKASRDDHAHAFANYGTDIKAVASANSAGSLNQAARVDHVHKGDGGGGNGLPSFAGANKHLATNADNDAAVWVDPPPDLSGDLDIAEADIDDLEFLTEDITAGIPSSAWADVTSASVAAMAVFNSVPNCAGAQAGTYTVSVSSGLAGKHLVIRLPTATVRGNVRLELDGTGGAVFHERLSDEYAICTSGATGYYTNGAVLGSSVTGAKLQTTGSAHIGTSTYAGDPLKVERWGIIGDSAGIPIAKTLPSITGHGGKLLTVNSSETGVEWGAGSPGNGGGGLTWEKLGDVVATGNTNAASATVSVDTFQAQCENADFFALTWANRALLLPTAIAGRNPFVRIWPQYSALFGKVQDIQMPNCTRQAGIEITLWAASGVNIDAGTYSFWTGKIGAGGGSSGPSIPNPTVAGKLQHLRVNAAGAAYELATPYSATAPAALGTAAAGAANTLARSDHVHPLPAIPQGSSDIPEADSANGSAGTSNKWSPSDHSHPITDHDSVTWTNALVSTLTGGGASGGVMCDGSVGAPTAASCKSLTDAFRRGDYNFFILRVARYDDNQNSEPLHISGCSLFPGIPSAIFAGDVVADTACTANSGKNSANTFNQYDVFVKFGNTGNYIQVRLPNYNSYGVTNVTVTLTGVR